ncbi:MAG TPA: squalene--hopene cyclase [Acidimicrobiia bacterium]|nr:squalene--hopene cyclase [Acidimicrobiia bacterium]
MAAVLGTSRAAVDVEGAVARARHHLLCRQSPEGWWKGELETNVTMDAEDLFLRHFLGIADDAVTGRAAAWIRSRQREDGTWATFHGGPGDLSTTVEAYAALRLAGDPPDADHMTRAASFVRAGGGVAASRVFTRLWLAAGGLWPWSDVPAVPPEVVLLPPAVPLNIYDFACWARQTIVAISVVAGRRPVWPLPIRLDELEPEPRQAGPAPRPSPWRLWSAAGRWEAFDRALQVWSRHPFGPLRARALEAAERWIVDRQEADGSWGGIQPPWVWSLLALRVLGYPLDHPVLRAGLDGLERFAIEENGRRRLEACQSPVWDTALAVVALTDAGLPGDHDAVRRAADWLLAREVRVSGDWSVRRPGVAPGGWAFEFANVNYPDVDDTAEVLLALDRAVPVHGIAGDAMAAAGARARRWVEAMQSRDGGWGAFDADNTRRLCTALPFCDFGEVIDPPSADVTAHALEMLAAAPDADPDRLRRGIAWLLGRQEADGSWFGRWGVNHVYGTGAAVPALVAAGEAPSSPPVRRAVQWLVSHQNSDGGWGEDIRSYTDPAWRGRGTSTPSQTAWALLALLAAGERDAPATAGGVAWLVDQQRADGTWDEPWFTGTGFPGDFSINYHLYRLVFPLMALGRYREER